MSNNFVDLWGWYDRFRLDAIRNDDALRLRMLELFDESWPQFESSPKKALASLKQGRALAEQLREKCWQIFFDYWQCEVYLFFIADYTMTLELAVRNAVECRKPEHDDCPVRARVFRVLVDTYLHIDPIGYEKQICENLDYLESQPVDLDTWRLLEARRASLAVELENWPKAEAATHRYIARSGNSDFRLIHGHYLLCKIAYEQGRDDDALHHALAGERYARRETRQRSIALFMLWQALFARKANDDIRAGQLFRAALARAAQVESAFGSFYEVLSDYHQLGGEYDQALSALDKQLAEAIQTGSAYEECDVRVERCKLLKQMGQPIDQETSLIRAKAQNMLKPEWFMKKLDAIN
jgi:hypothetical protein